MLVSGQSPARGLGLELAVKFSLVEIQNSKFRIQTQGVSAHAE